MGHQNALSNLNKASMLKTNHIDKQHQKTNSLSFNSYTSKDRKVSTSYSLSATNEIQNELNSNLNSNKNKTHRPHSKSASNPSSIGSFFKQKFQKQRSYNSQIKDIKEREHSNTISSYHAENEHPVHFIHDHSENTNPLKIQIPKNKIERPQKPLPVASDKNHGNQRKNDPSAHNKGFIVIHRKDRKSPIMAQQQTKLNDAYDHIQRHPQNDSVSIEDTKTNQQNGPN